MQNQSFFNEIMSYLTSDLSLAYLIVCFIIAGLGYGIVHYKDVKTGVRTSKKSPQKFSIKYWLKDNVIPVIVFIGIVYVYIRFSDTIIEVVKGSEVVAEYAWVLDIILGAKLFLSLLIGLFYDNIGANGLRKLVRKIVAKFSGNGGK